MPLILEIRDPESDRWVEVDQLIPGDPPGSISDYSLLLGGRQIYIFECLQDDSASLIHRSRGGVDEEIGNMRVVTPQHGKIIICRLRHSQVHTMTVTTDQSPAPRQIRFRHVQVDYGQRHCEICGQDVAANRFGLHTQSHGDEEIQHWPGGAVGYLQALEESLQQSLAAVEGFPRLRAPLLESLYEIRKLWQEIQSELN